MFISLIVIIGIIIIYFEHKNKKSYEDVFKEFFAKTCQNKNLPAKQKLFVAKQMIANNGYTTVEEENKIIGRRKIFSLGWFLATLSLYLIFYLYMQKPHTVIFSVNDDGRCSDESSASTM